LIKKQQILNLVVATVVLLGLVSCLSEPTRKQLRFNSNGKFKMVQFTDIHFGESHAKDLENQRLIKDVLDQEQPDLAIVTGDVVSGYAWDYWTRPWMALQYANFTKVLMDAGVYWATTAGNHDSQGDLTRQ
jgi:predicted MPP superfamily phosphohydrolase